MKLLLVIVLFISFFINVSVSYAEDPILYKIEKNIYFFNEYGRDCIDTPLKKTRYNPEYGVIGWKDCFGALDIVGGKKTKWTW